MDQQKNQQTNRLFYNELQKGTENRRTTGKKEQWELHNAIYSIYLHINPSL